MDCTDSSDEKKCEMLSQKGEDFSTYDKTIIPRSNHSEVFEVIVALEVSDILKIGNKHSLVANIIFYSSG